jgi:hypothetical protein
MIVIVFKGFGISAVLSQRFKDTRQDMIEEDIQKRDGIFE